MRIDILTLFPAMFEPILNESILKHAREKGLLQIEVHDIREAAVDKHKSVDDSAYGGGTGMVLRVDVIDRMLETVIAKYQSHHGKPLRILLSPQGERLNAKVVEGLAQYQWIILI